MEIKIILMYALLSFAFLGVVNGAVIDRTLSIVVNDTNTSVLINIDSLGYVNCTDSCTYDLKESLNCSDNYSAALRNCTESALNLTKQLAECQDDLADNMSSLDALIRERCTASEVIEEQLEKAVGTYKTELTSYLNETFMPKTAEFEQMKDRLAVEETKLEECKKRAGNLTNQLNDAIDSTKRLQGQNNIEFWIIMILFFLWLGTIAWPHRSEIFGTRKKKIKKTSSFKSSYRPPFGG